MIVIQIIEHNENMPYPVWKIPAVRECTRLCILYNGISNYGKASGGIGVMLAYFWQQEETKVDLDTQVPFCGADTLSFALNLMNFLLLT